MNKNQKRERRLDEEYSANDKIIEQKSKERT